MPVCNVGGVRILVTDHTSLRVAFLFVRQSTHMQVHP